MLLMHTGEARLGVQIPPAPHSIYRAIAKGPVPSSTIEEYRRLNHLSQRRRTFFESLPLCRC